jgi:hypothetical protein
MKILSGATSLDEYVEHGPKKYVPCYMDGDDHYTVGGQKITVAEYARLLKRPRSNTTYIMVLRSDQQSALHHRHMVEYNVEVETKKLTMNL